MDVYRRQNKTKVVKSAICSVVKATEKGVPFHLTVKRET